MKKTGRIGLVLVAALAVSGYPVQEFSAKTNDAWYKDLEPNEYSIDTSKVEDYGYISTARSEDVPSLFSRKGALRTNTLPSAYMNDISTLMTTYPGTRNQGNYNTCWAFSAVGLAEFDLITDNKTADRSVDFSELQLAYFTYNHATDPLGGTDGDTFSFKRNDNYLTYGGNLDFTARALLQWEGLVSESTLPYTLAASTDTLNASYAYADNVAHLQNVYILNINQDPSGVKQEIMAHGSVGIGYHAAANFGEIQKYESSGVYNGTVVDTVYCSTSKMSNHAVNIVGWDDDFPAENFATAPAGNGAWLIRNSWSDATGYNVNSYFWLSYYDATIEDDAWVFDFEGADNYDYNYQYDGCAISYKAFDFDTGANVFKVSGENNEQLKAVSISVTEDTNVPYTITVYTNLSSGSKPKSGTLAATVTGTTTYAGVYTIPLKNSVTLAKGTKFSVVVELGNGAGIDMECGYSGLLYSDYSVTASIEPGQSFVYYNGIWEDAQDLNARYKTGNFSIKAYTCGVGETTVSQVKNLKKKTTTKTSATISWSKVSGASGYEIYRSTSKTGTYKKVATVKSGSKVTYKDTGLSKNKTYYYKVRAYKSTVLEGESSATTLVGKMSSVVAAKTKKK